MIEYTLITSIWKTLFSAWAIGWQIVVMRRISSARHNLFWLMASSSMLLVSAGMAGGYYGFQRAVAIWGSCEPAPAILTQAGGAAINTVYALAALMLGTTAMRIFHSRWFGDMTYVVLMGLFLIISTSASGALVLQYLNPAGC